MSLHDGRTCSGGCLQRVLVSYSTAFVGLPVSDRSAGRPVSWLTSSLAEVPQIACSTRLNGVLSEASNTVFEGISHILLCPPKAVVAEFTGIGQPPSSQ